MRTRTRTHVWPAHVPKLLSLTRTPTLTAGVYSSPDSLLYRAMQQHLFRGHPIYSIDSGGDPTAIPALTYEAFADFHRTYYHPANARLFVYGDEAELPLAERLGLLQEYLGDFGAPGDFATETIPTQRLEGAPYEATEYYPADPDAKEEPKQFVSLAWLLSETPLPPQTKLALSVLNHRLLGTAALHACACASPHVHGMCMACMQVLNHLLLGTAASALEKPLMESGLGASVTGGGYGSPTQQPTFSVGLKGVALGDEAKEAVRETIPDRACTARPGRPCTRTPARAPRTCFTHFGACTHTPARGARRCARRS